MENYKINREKKTFVFDDGEEVPIPKDKVRQVLRSPAAHKSKQEAIEKWQQWQDTVPLGEAGHTFVNNLSESTYGNPGDTLANYAVSGYKALSQGEGQEGLGYIDRLLDHFYAMQEGRQEHLAGQSEKSPNAALAGQVGGLGLELGTLHGVPAKAALPIMGAGHSETSFLEPTEKLPEVGREVLIGAVLDKFFGTASKVAGHRQNRRVLQDVIRQTEEGNVAEIERAALANAAEEGRFANQTAAREAELGRLPQLQQAENQAFINSSSQNVERVSQTLGKTPIATEAMGVENFIGDTIESSVHAGTKEGKKVSNFLRSIFKGDAKGKISGEGIQKGMRAVDEMIIKEGGQIGEMLNDFKNYVTQELPSKLGNYFAVEKWLPKIEGRLLPAVEKGLVDIFKSGNEVYRDIQAQLGRNFLTELNQSIKGEISNIFKNNAANFETALADGTIASEVRAAIEANPKYQALVDNLLEYQNIVGNNKSYGKFNIQRPVVAPEFQQIKGDILALPGEVSERLTGVVNKYMPDIQLDVSKKSGVTQSSLNRLPKGPNIVPQPPPVPSVNPVQANVAPVPQIPAPQGVLQRLAYGLENLSGSGIMQGVKDNATTGLLAKMVGVPVAKMAGAAAGVVTGLSALTSPAYAATVGRSALEQTTRMMAAVEQRAAQYPSHRANGILENPQERRSLVKEIEDDENMRLEDKAIIQSKINRGQPLKQDIKQQPSRQQSRQQYNAF